MRFTTINLQEAKATVTHEGGKAYTLAPEQELVKMALTSFVDKSFYEKMSDKLTRLRELCKKVDPMFLLKLATWAREKGLRTVNQVMIMEWLQYGDREKYFVKAVKRPDEIIDMMGYYALVNSQDPKKLKVANKLKRAIKERLEKFDDYTLGKYKGKKWVVNLYDLVNISHAHSPSIDKLVKGTLEVSDTRETELSANGNTAESRKRLLKEEKLGALAFIRNLRNMMQRGIEHVELALYLEKLDFKKLFPFQAIQAADVCISECALNTNSTLYKVLDRKIHDSFDKFSKLFDGRVAIGIDNSGSMDFTINSKSKLMRDRMAAYYGVCLQEKTGGDLFSRGTTCIPANGYSIDQLCKLWGGSTDVNCLINGTKRKGYDTLFIITDEQSSHSEVMKSDIKNIVVRNIADYENTIIPPYDGKYTYITGFNDSMFELVKNLWDVDWLIKAINNLEI